MKKIALISAITITGLLFNSNADAQIGIRLGLNLAPRPVVYATAPVQTEYCEPANYSGNEDYYYLPEVDAYYSIPNQCYYYNDGRGWVSAAYLPGAYHDYDWRTARRFEVRAPRPFLHADYYRARYNGVGINVRWDRGYNRSYANDYHFNRDQYKNDNQRFDNMNRGDNNRQVDHNKEQNRDYDRRSAQQHFAQNNPQRGDWNERDNHRPGRF